MNSKLRSFFGYALGLIVSLIVIRLLHAWLGNGDWRTAYIWQDVLVSILCLGLFELLICAFKWSPGSVPEGEKKPLIRIANPKLRSFFLIVLWLVIGFLFSHLVSVYWDHGGDWQAAPVWKDIRWAVLMTWLFTYAFRTTLFPKKKTAE